MALSLSEFLDIKSILIEYITDGRDKSRYNNTFGFFAKTIYLFLNVNYEFYV
jgi:hypothetical protein